MLKIIHEWEIIEQITKTNTDINQYDIIKKQVENMYNTHDQTLVYKN